MAFDFPSSPAEGQVFTAPGGPTYVFNAPTWRAVGQGQIAIISDTPPPSPANGALWYESDSGILFIWYNDGNSSQWVQAGGIADHSADYVNVTGDTMTGNLTVSRATPIIFLNKTASGQHALIAGHLNGVNRWNISLGNATAETGSGNAGSDFGILRFNDAGTVIDTPMLINRGSGAATFFTSVASPQGYFTSGASFDSANNIVLKEVSSIRYLNFAGVGGYDIRHDVAGSTILVTTGGGTRTSVHGSDGSFRCTGPVYKPGGGAWGDSSDERIKTVLGPYTAGLDAIKSLNPIRYRFKGNDTDTEPAWVPLNSEDDVSLKEAPTVPYPNSGHYEAATKGNVYTGLIAQEVETILPNLVTLREGFIDGVEVPDIRILDTTPLIFALINAVKELSARVEALEGGAP